jgi:hypothetical protein
MGSQTSLARHRAASTIAWATVVVMVAAVSILLMAASSGAAPGARGFICTPGPQSIGRGSSCSDLQMTVTHEPSRVEIGRPFKAELAIHNFGPNGSFGGGTTETPTSSMTFVSLSAPGGFSCTPPAVGHTGNVTCTNGFINAGSTATIVVVWRPTASGSQNNQANVTSGNTDPNLGNNGDGDTVDVQVNSRGCTLIGTNAADDMAGTGGDDVICGLQGADHIDGGPGNDKIWGERGGDTLVDHNGTDTLIGGAGADSMDTQDGAAGDKVNGGLGTNTCTTDPGDIAANCS